MSRPGPLAGIRILDLTRLLPGPVATLHLADLGADVIKIEDPQVGDYARTLGTGQGEDSAYFRMINRNKQGLRLDMKKPEGVEVFRRRRLAAGGRTEHEQSTLCLGAVDGRLLTLLGWQVDEAETSDAVARKGCSLQHGRKRLAPRPTGRRRLTPSLRHEHDVRP